jgi:hypothetical protein
MLFFIIPSFTGFELGENAIGNTLGKWFEEMSKDRMRQNHDREKATWSL